MLVQHPVQYRSNSTDFEDSSWGMAHFSHVFEWQELSQWPLVQFPQRPSALHFQTQHDVQKWKCRSWAFLLYVKQASRLLKMNNFTLPIAYKWWSGWLHFYSFVNSPSHLVWNIYRLAAACFWACGSFIFLKFCCCFKNNHVNWHEVRFSAGVWLQSSNIGSF